MRDIIQAHQDPVFPVQGIDPTDLHRIQPHQVDAPAPGEKLSDPLPLNSISTAGPAPALRENRSRGYKYRSDCDCGTPSGAGPSHRAIAQHIQFVGQIFRLQPGTGKQFQRAGVHLGGQFPHLVAEGRGDPGIQVDQQQPTDHQDHEGQFEQEMAGAKHGVRVYTSKAGKRPPSIHYQRADQSHIWTVVFSAAQ